VDTLGDQYGFRHDFLGNAPEARRSDAHADDETDEQADPDGARHDYQILNVRFQT
jgi:hypothetical protein